ncbi:condensation domain-containing protein [Serratia quinivorans]|uniref:condensation domain-containing protein n=1 Tax=Serratia quinivorans TaxID=137545 RepID=UPI0021788E02|nr:condensation domain-containing protein [Serratia quinivorans]CAI0976252.1 Phenyloxazoline synthase MbtB [Serratia quinivorans]
MKALTTMQAAYWVGRQSAAPLGGVSAHLYAEFNCCDLDVERLRQAVASLYLHHPMLRLQVTADGQQTIAPCGPQHGLHLDDFSHADTADVTHRLAEKRLAKSSQMLPLEQGIPCDISLSLLPGGHSRLHVDLDMIAGDAMGFRVLMEDLARFYHQCPAAPSDSSVAYFDYLERQQADTELQARRTRAQAWWRERLAQLPPAPHLLRTPDRCRSDRLALQLSAKETQALEQVAKAQRITLSSLFLALFAVTVGHGWKLSRFRLNVPLFHRAEENLDNLIGDFSNLVLLGVELDPAENLPAFCRRLMAQLAELIAHSDYPGVSVMRDLSRLQGSMQPSPVVFTAGFGIRGKALFSGNVTRTFGPLEWVISQGPQVALDAQVAHANGGILINWDVRLDAFPEGLLPQLFATYGALLKQAANQPGSFNLPLAQWLAQCSAPALARQMPVRQLLHRLLARVVPDARLSDDDDINALPLPQDGLPALLAVVNKYLSVALTPADVAANPSPAALAALICQRAPNAAEGAQLLLKVLAPKA